MSSSTPNNFSYNHQNPRKTKTADEKKIKRVERGRETVIWREGNRIWIRGHQTTTATPTHPPTTAIATLPQPSIEETRSGGERVEAEEREIKACFLSLFSLLVISGSQIRLPSLHITLSLSLSPPFYCLFWLLLLFLFFYRVFWIFWVFFMVLKKLLGVMNSF